MTSPNPLKYIFLGIYLFFIYDGNILSINDIIDCNSRETIRGEWFLENLGKVFSIIAIIFSILIFIIRRKKKVFFLNIFLSLSIGTIIGIVDIYFENTSPSFSDKNHECQEKDIREEICKNKDKIGYPEAETSGDAGKPAIYIYPKKEKEVSVKLNINGDLTKVIPKYNNGWKVKVKPNGQMKVIGGNSQITYDYLFYEATLNKIVEPKEGWIVENKEEVLLKWFNKYLYKMGLNKIEAEELIDYWVPRLKTKIPSKFIIIKLFSAKYLDENMNLKIEPKPEKVLRIEFLFLKTNKNDKIIEPKIKKFDRSGYYAVEWGGTTIR